MQLELWAAVNLSVFKRDREYSPSITNACSAACWKMYKDGRSDRGSDDENIQPSHRRSEIAYEPNKTNYSDTRNSR